MPREIRFSVPDSLWDAFRAEAESRQLTVNQWIQDVARKQVASKINVLHVPPGRERTGASKRVLDVLANGSLTKKELMDALEPLGSDGCHERRDVVRNALIRLVRSGDVVEMIYGRFKRVKWGARDSNKTE